MRWMIPARAAFFTMLAVILLLPSLPVWADLRAPTWYDPDGVGSGNDWHYRVPVTLPATSSVNSTASVDADFSTLMLQLGITGSFDVNSIRVVRPGGALATIQEYTDRRFGGNSDASGNNRGEIRWIVEDGGAQTYYIYFDITENGVKPVNPQTPINANFERSTTGQEDPTGWAGSRVSATYDAQVRPNENVTVADNTTVNTNGSPNTGDFSYLIGARTNVDGSGTDRAVLERTITVPTTNPGNITVNWKPHGWDSSADGSGNYDFIRIEVIGATTTEMVGPTAGNYTTRPYSPNLGLSSANASRSGYGQYNGWDNTTTGTHTAGMTSFPSGSEPWLSHSISLAGFTGQTVTVRFSSKHLSSFRSWYLIDDLEWSVVNGTLGSAEGFGVLGATDAVIVPPGKILEISATVDAQPTAATNPVTASVLDNSGAVVASGIILYNDGTHGDATAGDNIWTNDGSDAGNPTYTIPLATPNSAGWTFRVFAKDSSNSTLGAANDGLVHRDGQPADQIEANYWNIDEISFDVEGAILNITKLSNIVSDGVSGSNPKAIPNALVQYCITIENTGTAAATNIDASDPLTGDVTYVAGSIRSGISCATATDVEDDNATGADETDTIGGSISGSTLTFTNTNLADGETMAITYRVTVD